MALFFAISGANVSCVIMGGIDGRLEKLREGPLLRGMTTGRHLTGLSLGQWFRLYGLAEPKGRREGSDALQDPCRAVYPEHSIGFRGRGCGGGDPFAKGPSPTKHSNTTMPHKKKAGT